MLICLVREWNLPLSARASAPVLSPKTTRAPSVNPNSSRKLEIHMASLKPSAAAIYSASVVERATTVWRLDDQDMAPGPKLLPPVRLPFPQDRQPLRSWDFTSSRDA